jgi:hypothetical protein
MYNLLVGFPDGEAYAERVVEYTDDDVKAYLASTGRMDTSRLMNLPTLVMPEIESGVDQVAHVGHIENLVLQGRSYRYRFIPSSVIPAIPSARVEAAASQLGVTTDWEFRRTHWAVKEVDLHRVLQDQAAAGVSRPSVFRFPVERLREADLVAVMMPFDTRFDPVYDALRQAATDAGLRCQRGDDIWDHDHIMDDVISLIWRARIVISDFTKRNPNVFYETGIAHSLGRDVIQITQATDDVPFDLRSIRSLLYLPNGEGLRLLRTQAAGRLRDLAARSRDWTA